MSRYPSAHFLLSAAVPGQFPPDVGAEVAFAGRSNAGKSSAINAIVQRHALARTSKTPGQTRLVNFFALAAGCRVVDLPGYGYAEVPQAERVRWVPLLEGLRARESLRGLILVVDARRGVGQGDEDLIAWADPQSRAVHVLLSKADKLGAAERLRALETARRVLGGRASVQLFSAKAKTGIAEAQSVLRALLQAQKTPVTS
ncbi:MAG: YihA family ribosome biogenesis GTP-binding protein [Gammaproteobacteria bacterium]|nr:YihA family ribosome biogenesis GTP-binding protein [Gammaproteobacteria bacterium]